MKLQGKTALITGGSRGIGRAIAKFFLENGANVIISARSHDELLAAQTELRTIGKHVEKNIETLVADVSKKEDAKALVKKTVDSFGGLDVVVNAAGVYGAIGPIHEVDFEKWKEAIAVNLFGTVNVIQEVIPVFMKAGKGKIINFSGGGDGPLPNFSAYSASKGAVVRLTETLAAELKGTGIAVNAIAPGPVNTKFLDNALNAGEKLVGKELYAKLLKQKDEGGVAPEKAAELCVFLASDASDGLSGKLVSAVWDDWKKWDKKYIETLMEGNLLTLRRINPNK